MPRINFEALEDVKIKDLQCLGEDPSDGRAE